MRQRVVLAVDGNSLVHRGFHARADPSTPLWAVRGLLGQLVAAVDRVRPDVVVVGFDDPGASWRRGRWPFYKAGRPPKLPSLVQQLAGAVAAMRDLGVVVVVPDGLEADDVLASVAARTRLAGGRTVVMTSDRDAFALIDDRTAVLRIIDGGVEASPLLTPQRLQLLLGIRPEQYPDFAALRGDPSDNLPGVVGIGARSAAQLLSRFDTAAAAFDDAAAVHAELGSRIGRCLERPGARDAWALNREVMTMRADLPMPLDLADGRAAQEAPGRGPATGGLPLDADAVSAVFRAHGLVWSVRQALVVLAHAEDPGPPPRHPATPDSHHPAMSAPSPADPGEHAASDAWRVRRHRPLRGRGAAAAAAAVDLPSGLEQLALF